jgi:hypothetical protein
MLGLVAVILPAAAISNNVSGSVAQSYGAGTSVLPSMLVEIKPKDKTTVIPLNSKDISNMLGVVVPLNNATIVLTPKTITTQQVLVASSGRYNLMVSNQGGPIKAGDYLTISSLPGISMKASASQSLIVGRAVDDLSGSSVISTVSLKNSQGSISPVAIGRISSDIQLAPNPLYLKNSNSILALLTRAEFDITNKTVSPIRTYICGLIFLATILITAVVLLTGTRAAIIAIGRNPLAKSAIGRSLIKTILAGLIVFAFGTASVYFILNR